MSRRKALGLLVAGGSVALGASASGLGLFGIVRKLRSYRAMPASFPAGASLPPGAIGLTSQARNSASAFVHPRSRKKCLLIHLPDGRFVAYERTCTHRNVFVNYDPATHQLFCPAHAAVFDPAHGGKVVRGPAPAALPQVGLRLQNDGTITAG